MAFPHPESRKGKDGNEYKPNKRGVVWNLFKRTVNVAEYRNAEDEMNPAKNGTFDGLVHILINLDSRVLSPLRRPFGRFGAELLCILGGQSLPAGELHRVDPDDTAERSSAE